MHLNPERAKIYSKAKKEAQLKDIRVRKSPLKSETEAAKVKEKESKVARVKQMEWRANSM